MTVAPKDLDTLLDWQIPVKKEKLFHSLTNVTKQKVPGNVFMYSCAILSFANLFLLRAYLNH